MAGDEQEHGDTSDAGDSARDVRVDRRSRHGRQSCERGKLLVIANKIYVIWPLLHSISVVKFNIIMTAFTAEHSKRVITHVSKLVSK